MSEARERDLLWCEALTQTLDPREISMVLRYFNEHRPDKAVRLAWIPGTGDLGPERIIWEQRWQHVASVETRRGQELLRICPIRERVMGNGDDPEPRERCEYTIERPAPIPTWEPDAVGKYPWDQMEPGDMLFLRCAPEERNKIANRLGAAAAHWLKTHKPHLGQVVRKVRGGVRIWFVQREEDL